MAKKPQHSKVEPTVEAVTPKRRPAAEPRKSAKLVQSRKKTKPAPPQSKSDLVLSLLKQSSGASLDDLMRATKWQAHSVRGFLSGAN